MSLVSPCIIPPEMEFIFADSQNDSHCTSLLSPTRCPDMPMAAVAKERAMNYPIGFTAMTDRVSALPKHSVGRLMPLLPGAQLQLSWIRTFILRGYNMIAFDMSGRSQEVEEILTLAKEHSDLAQASEPSSLDASRALNVGLPGTPSAS